MDYAVGALIFVAAVGLAAGAILWLMVFILAFSLDKCVKYSAMRNYREGGGKGGRFLL